MSFGPLLLNAESFESHGYQKRARDFLLDHNEACLFLDMGVGKTAIVLDAFLRIKKYNSAAKLMVVAPLMPATETWPNEVRKWKEFQHFKVCVLHGSKKLSMLRRGDPHKADITVVNYEGLAWLLKYANDMPTYAAVAADELTRVKTPGAKRSKAWRKLFYPSQRRWGLTGTPAPNGYEDLFGQMLAIDKGNALGKTMSEFRNRYYTRHPFLQYKWELQPGAAERIEARIAPIVMRMSAEDYLELPQQIDDVRRLTMPPAVAKQYKALKKDMLLALPDGVVTAANAAATYSKLAQLANGAIYVDEDNYSVVHDIKLDALAELQEEIAGKQLLVAYEFRHDIDRIKARFGEDNVPVLRGGMPADKRKEILSAWNRGEIKTLYLHASSAYGLNIQESSAAHICWFSATWNLEHYMQFVDRLVRQGNTSTRVFNHILCMSETIDELKITALSDKDDRQERLLQGLAKELGLSTPKEDTMAIRRLGEAKKAAPAPKAEPEQDASQDDDTPHFGPRKGRKKAAAPKQDAQPASGSPEHRRKIKEQVTGISGFSDAVKAQLGEPESAPAQAPVDKAKPADKAKTADKRASDVTDKDRVAAIVDAFKVAVEAIMRV